VAVLFGLFKSEFGKLRMIIIDDTFLYEVLLLPTQEIQENLYTVNELLSCVGLTMRRVTILAVLLFISLKKIRLNTYSIALE
jgi:hypothetical protein